MAFYSLEPWGTEAEDFRAGVVASTIANANRDPKQRSRPYQPQDFMPLWDKRDSSTPKQSPEEQRRVIEMWQAVFDGNTQHSGL